MKCTFPKFLLILICLALFSCESKRWKIDENAEKVDISIQRFEQDLFKDQPYSFNEQASDQLLQKYPVFLPLFSEAIMRFGEVSGPSYYMQMQKFVEDQDIRQLYSDVSAQYVEMDFLQKELSDAFTRYHYFFPDRAVPRVVTFLSAFSFSVVTDDSLLGVGLDNYLGADYGLYPKAGIPKYQFTHFEKKYMSADAINAWLTTEFFDFEGNNLLEEMIYSGKIMYLSSVFLPKKEENLILRYTREEMEWCEENEADIWFHFVDNDLLYTNDNITIRKYLGAAPFVAGFPEGSPGRVGHWMGFQIVKQYMEEHEATSLKQLLQKEASELLTESKYKPKRK